MHIHQHGYVTDEKANIISYTQLYQDKYRKVVYKLNVFNSIMVKSYINVTANIISFIQV